jgi:hypothetical protein
VIVVVMVVVMVVVVMVVMVVIIFIIVILRPVDVRITESATLSIPLSGHLAS